MTIVFTGSTAQFDDNYATVTPGVIEYTDDRGALQTFYFQCNPTSLTRTRTVTRVDSKAGNPAMGTKVTRGQAGRKFTHKVSSWRVDSFELWFDASTPYYTGSTTRSVNGSFTSVMEGIKHLETISEPGPVPSENESQTGAPPAPSPPRVVLRLGHRAWAGYVTSLTILEKEFTPKLVPRLVKATLSLDLVSEESKIAQGRTGASQ